MGRLQHDIVYFGANIAGISLHFRNLKHEVDLYSCTFLKRNIDDIFQNAQTGPRANCTSVYLKKKINEIKQGMRHFDATFSRLINE